MIEIHTTGTFVEWLASLRDRKAAAIVSARLLRLRVGLLGDVKPIGEGVSELRINYGPGYRVYFVRRGAQLVILLCGGDKSSQSQDIRKAQELARQL